MIFEHDLTKVKLVDLHFDKTNPNQLTQEQMKGLRLSMERFGYLTPIVIDQNNQIADGEHRALVYKEFGLTEIPAYRVTFTDDTERRLLRQTMNKLRGMHDHQLDADEMALIYESNKLPDLSGLIAQQEATIKELMLRYRPELPFGHEDDAQIDQIIDEQLKRTAPDTQLGDIYQLGNHRLICADCTDKRAINRLLEDKEAIMVFTDPPYGIDYHGIKREFDDIKNDITTDGFKQMLVTVFKSLPETGYICCNWKSYRIFEEALTIAGRTPKSCIVWDKERPVQNLDKYFKQHEFILYFGKFGGHKTLRGDIWRINRQTSIDHPTQKPPELARMAIEDSSDLGQAVYDPFLGSGSTMIACEQTGRNCYGVEIDPHYCDVIVKRWEAYTGQKAIKLS